MAVDYELVRLAAAGAMLASASFFDLRTRMVSDYLWIIFGAIAGLLFIFDMPNGDTFPLFLFSIAITSATAAVMYKTKIVGQADILALLVFASILPIYDHRPIIAISSVAHASMEITTTTATSNALNPIAPLSVLMNATILVLFVLVRNVSKNIAYLSKSQSVGGGGLFEGFEHESRVRKAMAFVIGYKTSSCSQFVFPIEEEKSEGQKSTKGEKKRFDFSIKDTEKRAFVSNQDIKQKQQVWVTSGIPFLLFMLAGFAVYIIIGDIPSLILQYLTHL